VRADTFFHAREKNVVEFEAFRTVEGDEGDARPVFEGVGIADKRGGVEKIGERFAGVEAFGDGASEFFEIFYACDVFWSVAVLEHGHVPGFVEDVTQEFGRFAFGQCLLETKDEFLKARTGVVARPEAPPKGRFRSLPRRGTVGAGGVAERVDRGFADAARGNVEDAEKGNIVLGMHGEADVSECVFDFGAVVKTETADEL